MLDVTVCDSMSGPKTAVKSTASQIATIASEAHISGTTRPASRRRSVAAVCGTVVISTPPSGGTLAAAGRDGIGANPDLRRSR